MDKPQLVIWTQNFWIMWQNHSFSSDLDYLIP